MNLLEKIQTPEDVRLLVPSALPALADALRATIIETVSKNGGHLASSLGTVELTIALLRVFDPPQDDVVWDVGHQTYAWKLLTGRGARFATLRTHGGISGFPNPSESPYDAAVAGHAGAALSTAEGMAVARDRQGKLNHVIAVIGDASMTNGISLEALNACCNLDSKVIVILNDNEMSIDENVGAFARKLGWLLSGVRYNRIKAAAERAGHTLRLSFLRTIYHRLEQAIKSIWLGNAFFESFGLRYIGPIDGHDFTALENALTVAREDKRSVIIHIATQKGRGFRPAERDPSAWHGVGKFDPTVRNAPAGKHGYSWMLGESLCRYAAENPQVMAVTAAMSSGTGLDLFAQRYPKRFFDVGICEEHATIFCAGLAARGFHPVFAIYSTFLQRAVDCVMHDVCLQALPVVFCIDRAGIVGNDGRTHHGVFDIPMIRCLPGLTIMQPKNLAEFDAMLGFALHMNGPVAIRYPRDCVAACMVDAPVADVACGVAEVVHEVSGAQVWLWALGDMVPLALETAALLATRGVAAGVVNARFIKPLDTTRLHAHAAAGALIATFENGVCAGGFGSAVREALADVDARVMSFGWADAFVGQGTTEELFKDAGLTATAVADALEMRLK